MTLLHRMKYSLLAIWMASAIAPSAWSAENAELQRWRSYSGVTWNTGPEASTAFRDSVNAPIAGIHFDGKGRAFVSTPRLLAANTPATLSILDTSVNGGPAQLTAFPSLSDNSVSSTAADHLRNVLGFYIDRRNGWLWALDMGFVAGEDEAPAGSQKVVVYDLQSGHLVKRISLDTAADRKGSFLNDIAVDEIRKIAYISDSGLRSAPNNQAAIIIVDFSSGASRRILDRHASVMPEHGAKVVSHGADVWPDSPLLLGINGIALSPDSETLYWAVTTGTHAFSISTKTLRNASLNEHAIFTRITPIGNVGGNTDGLVVDHHGDLYITDVTHNGIVRFDPHTREMKLLASDEGVFWPDTPSITPDGDLVVTASRLSDHFAGKVRPGAERYELWKMPLVPRGKRMRSSEVLQ